MKTIELQSDNYKNGFKRLKSIHKSFCLATGLNSIIIDRNGKIISEHKRSYTFCNRFKSLRKGEKNTAICNQCSTEEINFGTDDIHEGCRFPLWGSTFPIKIAKKHVATIFIGEILTRKQDDVKLEKLARKCSITLEDLKKNLSKIPILTEEKRKGVCSHLQNMSKMVSHHYYETQNYKETVERLKVLDKICKSINSPSELSAIYEVINDQLSKLIHRDIFCILLMDENKDELRAEYTKGTGETILEKATFKGGDKDQGFAGRVLKTNTPYITGDAEKDAKNDKGLKIKYEKLLEVGLKSFLVVPLQIETKIVGCFIIASKKKHEYHKSQAELIYSFAQWAAIAIHKYELISRKQEIIRTKEIILGEYLQHVLTHKTDKFRAKISLIIKDNEKLSEMYDWSAELYNEMITNATYYLEFIENQDFQPNLGKVWVKDLLNEIISLRLKANIKCNNIKIEIETRLKGDQDIYIWADRERLYCVFINLISNAIKFGKDGDNINIILRLHEQNEKKTLYIDIVDEGCGILEKDKTIIFEAFERGSDTKNIIGGGLGLYITNKILSAHKWKQLNIINNDNNNGCTASMEISDPEICPFQILVIDDEETVCRTIHNYLKEMKCSVFTCSSLSQAESYITKVQRNKHNKIILIIVDVMKSNEGIFAANDWFDTYNYDIILVSQKDITSSENKNRFTFFKKPFSKSIFLEKVKAKLASIN